MAAHKPLHLVEAKSADTRISRDQPTVARLNFSLANGEGLVVEVPRYVLERLLSTASRPRAFNRPFGPFPEQITRRAIGRSEGRRWLMTLPPVFLGFRASPQKGRRRLWCE